MNRGGDPILESCYESFPERPNIDASETIYTREQLAFRIDYWMQQLSELTTLGQDRQALSLNILNTKEAKT